MNKKTLFVIPLLITLLIIPYLTLTVQASFQGSFEELPRYFDATMPYSYFIDSNSTHYFMFNGTTHQMETSNTNADNIAQWCIGNITEGGTIKLGDNVVIGTLTIPYSNIHISGNKPAFVYNWTGTPRIEHLIFTSSTQDVEDCSFSNMYICEVIFRPDSSYRVRGVIFDSVDFLFTRYQGYNSHGMMMNATSASQSQERYCDFVTCIHCGFTGYPVDGYGHINFVQSGGGTSTWNFISCNFGLYVAGNQYFIKYFENGFGNRHKFIGCSFTTTGDMDNTTLINFGTSNIADGWYKNLGAEFTHCSFEIHSNLTFIRIGGGTKTDRQIRVAVDQCMFTSYDSLTLINNSLSSFGSRSYVEITNNKFVTANDVMIGASNDSANFVISIKDNFYYNPVGAISNPVEGTYLIDSGSGSIVDNTQYEVRQSPKTIYMQDGSTFDVYVNGDLVFNDVNYAQVNLSCEETFKIDHDGTMDTLAVYGQ